MWAEFRNCLKSRVLRPSAAAAAGHPGLPPVAAWTVSVGRSVQVSGCSARFRHHSEAVPVKKVATFSTWEAGVVNNCYDV